MKNKTKQYKIIMPSEPKEGDKVVCYDKKGKVKWIVWVAITGKNLNPNK